jgi:hypothetical protein
MKKILFLIIFGTFLFTGAQAQFGFGVKGGLTLADNNIDVEPDTVHNFLLSYHGSVFFKIGEGLFTFQPEIRFSRRGTYIDNEPDDYYHQVSLNYIDVPLMLRIGFNFKLAEIYFNFGPYAGYAISAKSKERLFDEEQNMWVVQEGDYDFDRDILDRWDFGVGMGAGVRVLMVFLEFRYNQGVLHIARDYYTSSNNKFLDISLGVQF